MVEMRVILREELEMEEVPETSYDLIAHEGVHLWFLNQ